MEVYKDREDKDTMTVDELVDMYFAKKQELRESTMYNYKTMYNKYVRGSEFGQKSISEVLPYDVEMLYRELHFSSELKMNTINTIHNVLHPAFNDAVAKRLIFSNPSNLVFGELCKKIRENPKKVHALTRVEQRAFLDYVSRHPIFNRWTPILIFLLGTGLRIGECLGLRWSDLKDVRMLHVVRSLAYRPSAANDNHCSKLVTDLKTEASNRHVPMSDFVKKALEQEKRRIELMGFHDVKSIDGVSDFVFLNRYGQVLTGKSVNEAIKRIIKHYNEEEMQKAEQENREPILLPHFSCHNLRHTFCTRLVESNKLPMKLIQEIMGHKDIRTSMNVYAEILAGSLMLLMQDLNLDENIFPHEDAQSSEVEVVDRCFGLVV